MSRQPDTQRPPATRQLRELYYELGRALLERQRHAEAVAAFQNALKEEGDGPAPVEVRVALSDAYEQAGEKGAAFVAFLEALASEPAMLEEQIERAHELLPRVMDKADLKWTREEWAAKILGLAQTDAARFGVSTLLGRVKLYSQDYAGAAELFESAVGLSRDDPRALEGLGESLWEMGRPAAAIEALTEAYKLAERGTEARRAQHINSKLARILAEQGHYAAALARVSHVQVADDPNAYLILVTRSHCSLALGMPGKALRDAELAAELQPKGVQAHLKRAQALTSLKKYRDAINVADQALQYDPANGAIILAKAQALVEGQIDLEQARRLLTRLKERAGGYEAISKFLSPAVTQNELGGNTHYFLAHLNRVLGRPEEALREVGVALDLGLSGDNDAPSAPAVQLKGELLLAGGDAEQGAAQLVEAGRLFMQRADYAAAVKTFETAAQARPDDGHIYWYWADALRTGSYTQEYPYKDRAVVERALELWRKGFALGRPTKEFAWAYLLPGLVLEALAVFTTNQKALYREALFYAERSLLLDAQNEYAWTYLARFTRMLSMESGTMVALGQALALAPNDPQILVERLIIGVNIGEKNILEFIEEHREKLSGSGPWFSLVEAYALSFHDRHEESVRKLSEVTDDLLSDPDLRSLRGAVYRRAGMWPEAEADSKLVWEATAPGAPQALPGTLFTRAWTGCLLGHYEEAERIFRGLREDGAPDLYDLHTNLFYCALGKGHAAEARAELAQALPLLRTERQALETLLDLKYFEHRLASPVYEAVGDIIETCRRELQSRIPRLAGKSYGLEAAEAELEQAAREEASDDPETWRRAVQMGLARVRVALGKFEEAAALYQSLSRESPPLPEAQEGLRAAVERATAAGDQILETGATGDAVASFERALRLAHNQSSEAGIRARVGLARLALAAPDAALAEFDQALALYRAAGLQPPGGALGAVARQLTRGAADYWRLDELWQAAAVREGADEELRRDYAEARASLSGYLAQAYQLHELAADAMPLVEQVKVYLGEELVTTVAEQETELVQTHTPEMRKRIEQDWGVRVPPVRFTDNTQIPPKAYIFLLDELPAQGGIAHAEMRFSPEAPERLRDLGLGEGDLVEAVHPTDSRPGAWVKPEHWQRVEGGGLELWSSPLVYLLRHLETLLRNSLTRFVGVQEVETLLAELRRDEELALLVRSALPDQASAFKFARVLRELVRENVPINGLAELLRAARTADLAREHFREVLRRVRLQIKELLPGNRPGTSRTFIPETLEAQIASYLRDDDGEPALLFPVGEVSDLLAALKELLTGGGEKQPRADEVAFVVRDAGLRFYVSEMLAAWGVNMVVMSEEELLPEGDHPGATR